MNGTMTADEVKLAMRIIGLRGTRMKATRNGWDSIGTRCSAKDLETVHNLRDKGHVEMRLGLWALSGKGIQQLKQQIGEFHF